MTNPKQIAGEERTLLEMAARAAGLRMHGMIGPKFIVHDSSRGGERYEWNPKESNDDAFRLAVKLQLSITNNSVHVFVTCCHHRNVLAEQFLGNDPAAAARLAITRAAASIGASMKEEQA